MTFKTENAAGSPPPNAQDDVALSALHDGGEFGWKGRAQTCDAAMWRLFEMPSSDITALARKLEITFAPETDLAGMLDADAARALILQAAGRACSVCSGGMIMGTIKVLKF